MDEDGDTDSEVEEYSGMEQPPLIKQLKTILAEYPDDGQIIKELVQNAEDAVASEMRILYDGRTINTTTAKKLPYRKFFKAPALCFYNNAVFSDNDWRGIRMIYSSVKEEDPLKVGRFGLGFKSVFHITDNPCIISGSKILLMNPHEKVPDKVCISMKLKDLKKCKRMKVEEFEDALLGTFGFTANTLKTGNYDGTIFWFPLRETPSELSDTIYDRDKVLDLFKSFQTEAVHSLLFLKSLCKIELFCRGSETELDLPEGQEFFSVELHDSTNTVKNARAMFLREIKDTSGNIPNNDIVCIVQPRFETRFRTAGVVAVEATRSSWLVINVYKGGEMSERLRHLVSDKDLSYSPYVGAAVLLDDCSEPFKGHVFCFLPLPQEKKSLTGLPLHFNGFFALSQNRRHLKWASADQDTLHMHRDKAIEWNECLVNEVLPQIYMRLITEMITISGTHGHNGTSVEAVYKCIPDKSVVEDKWLGCVESLHQNLLQTDVVFVPNHSKWVQPLQPLYTMFNEQNVSCDTKDTVINTVNHCRTVEATIVPIHVWEWVRKIDTVRDISPAELSKLLLLEDAYKNALTPVEKLRILEYITKDNEFELLQGLELLPLETGSFVTFQGHGSTPATLFMCTKEEVSLFPGLEEKFILTDVQLPLKEALQTLADLERSQIKHMTITDIVILLETTIRKEIGKGDPVTLRLSHDSRFANWIESIWVYIMKHYPKNISQFIHLPLIPCLASEKWNDGTWRNADVRLYTMKRLFILQSGTGIEELPNGVLPALEYLSIVVLPSLPEWFHVGEFSCIFTPTGNSLLELFDRLQSSNVNAIDCFNNNTRTSHIDALVVLLDRINMPFTDRTIAFLQQLRLFRQYGCLSFIDMQTTFTSIRENNQIVNLSDSFPVPFPRPLLIPSSKRDLRIARKLKATEVCEEKLVVEVFQSVSRGLYSNDEVKKLMIWFLANIHKFQSNVVVMSHAKNVSFIPNGKVFCKPSELYDPRDAHLQTLFMGENKFPVGEFISEINLNAMAILGLKKRQHISANCVYATAEDLDHMYRENRDIANISQKASALFQLLEEKPDILKSTVTHTCVPLHVSISLLKCILHERERPNGYPKDLVWKGSEYILCSPAELKSGIFTNTVGSLTPLVKSSDMLCQMFQWNSKPGAKELTEHLQNIITAYSSSNKPDMLPLISNVYKAMAEHCSEVTYCPQFQELLQSNSIWWGDQFCSPNQIILEKRDTDIDLQPYMYPLPAEFKKLQSFFASIGCHLRQDTSALLSVQAMIAESHQKPGLNDENRTRKDLHIVLQILNKLSKESANVTDIGEKLLFPIHSNDKGRLVLKPSTQCTYCDALWLKELAEDDEEDEEIIYVHGDVPLTVAEGLGVKSLKKQLMSDAEGLEEWGQEEPLTRRLHNLLKDGYVDGLAVPKELVQNADDAGASTVQFSYDERENSDARMQLLDEGMADCQGPALWAYNDALFSKSDLINITKLSGATKETDTTKIGKFGLGFCSVYNLTDVPSFISGQNMILFDPHTKYLNKALPGRSPGLKINLQTMKNKRLMKRMKNQFKPFQGVFGCDLSEQEPHFNGTLFRFPLRTKQQAATSEIKNTSYTKEEMITLLRQFVEASGNLLLFTQNILEIKLFHTSGVHPYETRLLCTVNKEHAIQGLNRSVLDICSDMKINELLKSNPFTAIQHLIITVNCDNHENILGEMESESSRTNWLVSWATGNARSLQLSYSTNIKGALPLGSVALLIDSKNERLTPKALHTAPFGFYKTSHIFCYLPLPIEIQLEVHLNGSFAVTSNRRGLQTNTEDDKYSYDSQWNEALIADAVAQAFINLLGSMHTPAKLICPPLSSDYKFYQVWPVSGSQISSRLTEGFYTKAISFNSPVFESYGNWLGFKQCIFLGRSMVLDPAIRTIAVTTLQKFRTDVAQSVVDLPDVYFDELRSIKGWENSAFVVERDAFYVRYFFPNIASTFWEESEEHSNSRDKMLLYCIEHSSSLTDEKLQTIDCIPTKPNGLLRKPRDLVHPAGNVSSLFSTREERFPSDSFCNRNTLNKLVELGMMKQNLDSELVLERAASISGLQFKEGVAAAVDRCKHLMMYISNMPRIEDNIFQKIKGISFLPILDKPKNWPFRWKSEILLQPEKNADMICFEKPENLFLDSCKNLASCEKHILDSKRILTAGVHSHVFESIGVKSVCHIGVKTVVNQLLAICTESKIPNETCSKPILDEAINEIYEFLNRAVSDDPESMKSILSVLQDKPVILLGSEFVSAKNVAFTCGYNCIPELYEIGRNRMVRYKRFLECIGVKDQFEVGYVVQIIMKTKTCFQDSVLPQDVFELVLRLLLCLTNLMTLTGMSYEDVVKQHGKNSIIAPDSSMILRPTFLLCFDDINFAAATSTMRYIHDDVSRTTATKLGVLTKRRKHLKDCSIEIPFEQKEELVTRLQRLLDGYPCDIAVFKELVQNADDANATEIHFVRDLRTHGCDTIFEETYSEFQGPALCVFNDKPFTPGDLVGIQKLGIGSKAEDHAKTGQYGVGFNAVYNITDLPSFLTKGPDIEGGETLCILDPLHKHSKETVGTRYINMQAIRRTYPDVLAGYNEKHFFSSEKSTGTVFRFPLRQSESEICRHVVSENKLESLFSSFEQELSKMLLFLRHIRKITLSTITDKEMKTEHSVSMIFTDEDLQRRKDFFNYTALYCRELKESYCNVLTQTSMQIGYEVNVKDSLDKDEKWYIVQRYGLPEDNIPGTVVTAAKQGQLGMLPLGGVAVRATKTDALPKIAQRWGLLTMFSRRTMLKENHKAYCFLPLPGITGLPLHVNGHFILDHETRRGLWKKDSCEEFKSDWNELLLSSVVTTSFVEALSYSKSRVLFQKDTYSETEVSSELATLDSLFPLEKETKDNNWKYLVKSVLQNIINSDEKLFPVTHQIEAQDGSYLYTVNWYSFRQNGHQFPVFFTHMDIMKSLTDEFYNLLRTLGMKITNLSLETETSFTDCQISIPRFDSNAVVEFLKSYSSTKTDKAKIDTLPYTLEKTLFRNSQNVNKVLLFCSCCDSFQTAVDGLPLLITADGLLRCFRTDRPVFCTEFAVLFPNLAEKFVHREQLNTLSRIDIARFASVLSEWHIKSLASILPSLNETQRLTGQNAVPLHHSSSTFLNESWVSTLWTFLEEDYTSFQAANAGKSFADFLEPLDNWCLVPAYQGQSSQILVKISKSSIILSLDTFASSVVLSEAFQKLEVPCLNTKLLSPRSEKLILPSVGRADNPVSVLFCLNHCKEDFLKKNLSCTDCSAILGYFSDHLNCMKGDADVTWISESLKALPFFITKDGQRVSFSDRNCKVLVLPEEIPEDGLKQWAHDTGTILLRNDVGLDALYRVLGFTYTESIDVYLEHILKSWACLPATSFVTHLKYMKDHLLSSLGECFDVKQSLMLQVLKELPVIADCNGNRKASDYFSPHNRIFQMMCKENDFPPKTLFAEEWKRFLELIGLKHLVTGPMFVGFAKEIAAEARNGITESSAIKSERLVEHLFVQECRWEQSIYEEISQIKFVAPHIIDSRYSFVHKQYSTTGFFICFRNSILRCHSQLTWSSMHLLPSILICKRNKRKLQLLGIHREPPVESVVRHTENICQSLKRICGERRNANVEFFEWLESFLDELYSFLQLNCLSSESVKKQLYNTPLVFIPESKLFVPAHAVIEDMLSLQEIRPYVVKAPPRYGKFFRLFENLGTEKYPSYLHYIKVLALIKEDVGNNKLTQKYLSEWGVIKVALENMLSLLKQLTEALKAPADKSPTETALYLPSRDKRLVNANDLTVADNQFYERRLSPYTSLTFVMDLKALKLKQSILITRRLPAGLRPQFLTDIVKEKVDTSDMVELQSSPTAATLETFIHSEAFLSGILRILKHYKTEAQLTLREDEEQKILHRVQNTRVKQVTGLKTLLHLSGVRVEGSAEMKDCFVPKPSKDSADMHMRIYFQRKPNETESVTDFIESLDVYLIRFINYVTQFNIPEHLIMKLFRKINDKSGISIMLDRIPIDPYHLPSEISWSVFPDPGTFVPVELHHLLNCDFSEFMPHEYSSVALEVEDDVMLDNDDTETYAPAYIYVRIEGKVPSDSEASIINQRYSVFTGSEIKVVKAFKIYKFIRPEDENVCTDVVDTGGISGPKINQSFEEAFYSVRHALQEAWKLPEEDRRHVIKRLYLKWHPDKNLGNEEFCSSVFRYIKEVIYKLENNISLDDSDVTDGHSRPDPDFTSSHYFRFCERMDNRGRYHREQARTFYSSGPSHQDRGAAGGYSAGFTHRDSCSRPYPYLREAKRWQRQAEVDLRTALETIDARGDPPAYNWTCYMCHQASEKSLKAAGFALDANRVDSNSHDVGRLASGLLDDIQTLAVALSDVVGFHTKMRYPDVLMHPEIPSTVYTRGQADMACEYARQILALVGKNYVK